MKQEEENVVCFIHVPFLSKIHLPPLLPYPLQMTGVVEKITDPGPV
jgi:hypothetical protein